MNPVHLDLTFIAQAISFLLITLIVFGVVYFIFFFNRHLKRNKDISKKLDQIIKLLERNEAQK